MNGSLIIMGDSLLLIIITPKNGSLVIMGDSLLFRFVTLVNGSLFIMVVSDEW